MITIVYTGSLVNFIPILPVCSWIFKNKNEKFLFILDKKHSTIKDVLSLQPFTDKILFEDIENSIYYDPRNTELAKIYDFNKLYILNDEKLIIITENSSRYYANEINADIDYDFVLNLNLVFKYHSDEISTLNELKYVFPYYVTYDELSLLDTLQNLAYSKERHLPHSYITLLLAYAGIHIYLYLNESNAFSTYWGYYSKKAILDIRQVGEGVIKSIYNTIYFI